MQLTLNYSADQLRQEMIRKKTGESTKKQFYINKYYEREIDTTSREYHYIYSDKGVVALYVITAPVVDTTSTHEPGDLPGWLEGPRGAGDSTAMYYIHTDHLGSYCAITNANKQVVQRNFFEAWGTNIGAENFTLTRRGFTGHEHYPELKIINMGGRLYDPVIARFFSPDNYVQIPEFTQSFNRYSYCLNNPLSYTDPTGQRWNPVYNWDGKFLGNTIEGFTGEVLVYSGQDDIEWNKMCRDGAKQYANVSTYDNVRDLLSNEAKSNIWTNIAAHFAGKRFFDEIFSMDDLIGGKIHFGGTGYWNANYVVRSGRGTISGADRYGDSFETTVENIASSIIIHEWYSHIRKNNSEDLKSHRLAYKNTINDPVFWEKTTDAYKGYTLRGLRYWTEKDTGRPNVDALYLDLYNKYSGIKLKLK